MARWIVSSIDGLLRLPARLGKFEFATLAAVLFVGAGLWIFVVLADNVVDGETQDFDHAILLALRNPDDTSDPLGPRWVEELGRDATALGGVGVLLFITLAVAGFLLLSGKRHAAVFVLAAVLSGLLVSSLLKWGFARARPDLVPHGSHVSTSSFPSGHSMMATTTYLTLGALLARVSERRVLKFYFLFLAVLLSAAVGISRIYLGVHWPTDVFAGWTVGASWAMLCWLTFQYLQRTGQVEREGEETQPAKRPA